MQLSDKIKKFSVEQAIDYLNRNPVKNLPKLLDWADTFCAGKFEGQRRAIRKAYLDPTDAHYPMVQHILNDVDPGVRKTTLVNFFIYGNDASPSRQPPQPRRRKERAQKANTRKNTKKQRFPFGKRCFSSLPRKGEGLGCASDAGHATGGAGENHAQHPTKSTASRSGDGAFARTPLLRPAAGRLRGRGDLRARDALGELSLIHI